MKSKEEKLSRDEGTEKTDLGGITTGPIDGTKVRKNGVSGNGVSGKEATMVANGEFLDPAPKQDNVDLGISDTLFAKNPGQSDGLSMDKTMTPQEALGVGETTAAGIMTDGGKSVSGSDLGAKQKEDAGQSLGKDPGQSLGKDPGQSLGEDPGKDLEDELLTHEHPGRYQRTKELGRGGIGRVLLARDRHLGREVAIKELLPSVGGGSGGGRLSGEGGGSKTMTRTPVEIRFVDEARITGQLEHPGIVPVHELGRREDGRLYYTMKMVRGDSLAEGLRGCGLEGRLRFLPNFLELCHAMAYAHSRGVVHRDLKPANVMLGEFGETIVVDWGLAKVKGEHDAKGKKLVKVLEELEELKSTGGMKTVAGMPLGTPAYMSPEGARGEVEEIDERSDIYSLGAILYEILTGRPPHGGKTGWDVVKSVREKTPKAPCEIEGEVPKELSDIAMRALAQKKEDRYADAKEMAEDIKRFQAGDLVKAHRYTLWDLTVRWVRHRWPYLAAAVVLVLVAGGMWWYRGYSEKKRKMRAELVRRVKVRAQIEGILSKASGQKKKTNWFDVLTFKLLAHKEPLVEKLLIQKLSHPKKQVRRLAARALGGMKSRMAVVPLCDRLKEGVEPSPAVVIEVITALGIIGDSRAEIPVRKARWRYGQHGYVWKSTVFAFKMIPLPPIPKEGLSANELTDRGRAAENKGLNDLALKLYSQAIQKDPQLGRAYGNRANIYRNKGFREKALADYDKAIELTPDEPANYNNRGLIRKHMENYEGALKDFTKIVDGEKIKTIGLLNRAGVYKLMGKYKEALADFHEAIKIRPQKTSAHNNLSFLLRDMGHLKKALKACEKALRINPKYLYGLKNKAEILLRLGDMSGAKATLEEVFSVDPNNIGAKIILLGIYFAKGDLEKVKAEADSIIDARKKEAFPYKLKAAFYFAPKGDFFGALAHLRKGESHLKRPLSKIKYRLMEILVLLRAGRKKEAQKAVANLFKKWRKDKKLWIQRAAHFLAGKLPPSALNRKQGPMAAGRGEKELVYGIKAELEGNTVQALGHYQKVLSTKTTTNFIYPLAWISVQRISKKQNLAQDQASTTKPGPL